MNPAFEPGLVSVIIPAYNRAALMSETLDSIWAQSYRPIEVLLVDDGSKENIHGTLKTWLSSHPESDDFQVFYHRQQNAGAPTARNCGLRQSRGEFIQFLDNDDLLGENKLRKQIRMLREQDVKVAVYAQSQIFLKHGGQYVLRKTTEQTDEHTLRDWLSRRGVLSHCLLWQRADVRELGPWQEDLTANQDGEYGMRFLLNGGRMLFCPTTKAYYRLKIGHVDSISHARTRAADESRLAVLERIEQGLIENNELVSYRNELARSYLRLAVLVAPNSPDISAICREKCAGLSPGMSLRSQFRLHHWLLYRVFGMKRGVGVLEKLQAWKMEFLVHRLPGNTLARDASELYRE